jgi:ATP-dependent Lon protease
LLQKSIKGGMIVVGGLNLGGSINTLHNAVSVVELAVEKGAPLIVMPVSSRRQLLDLSDEMATRIDVQFYSDAREALLKALCD